VKLCVFILTQVLRQIIIVYFSVLYRQPCGISEVKHRAVRFHVLMAASMKFRVFWYVAAFSHVEIY
jgi:hypothetical protein